MTEEHDWVTLQTNAVKAQHPISETSFEQLVKLLMSTFQDKQLTSSEMNKIAIELIKAETTPTPAQPTTAEAPTK